MSKESGSAGDIRGDIWGDGKGGKWENGDVVVRWDHSVKCKHIERLVGGKKHGTQEVWWSESYGWPTYDWKAKAFLARPPDTDRKLIFSGEFKNGLEEGDHIWWYWRTGMLQSRVPYRNGLRDGQEERWWHDGNLQYKGWFKNGKQQGVHESWMACGKLWASFTYQDGLLHGPTEIFHPFGGSTVTRYERGKPVR